MQDPNPWAGVVPAHQTTTPHDSPPYYTILYLDVVGLGGLSPSQHVVEPGEDVLREVDALGGLANPTHGDSAHAVEHIRVAWRCRAMVITAIMIRHVLSCQETLPIS